MGKRNTGLFNFGMTTSLGEGKPINSTQKLTLSHILLVQTGAWLEPGYTQRLLLKWDYLDWWIVIAAQKTFFVLVS